MQYLKISIKKWIIIFINHIQNRNLTIIQFFMKVNYLIIYLIIIMNVIQQKID